MTNLQLKIVNSFILKAKQLLEGDPIIDEIAIFVAAGDNPEYRDVVTILRQITQGLERFKERKGSYLWDGDFDDELMENTLDEEDATPFFTVKR